jgi:hypothetical protein
VKRVLRASGWVYIGGMIATAGFALPTPWWLLQTPSQIAVSAAFVIFWPIAIILHWIALF